MKRIFGLVIALCLLLSAIPAVGLAAEDFVLFTPWSNTSTDADMAEVRAEIEKQLAESGIDLSLDWIIVPTDGALEKLNVMLTGGDRIDAVTLNIGDADKYTSSGDLAMPLNELLEQYGQNLLKAIPEEAWIPCKNTKGEIIYIPDYYQWRWQGCAIRTDLLKEQGLEMPTTIAELENVMEVFKNAYPDMIPATGLPWFSDPFLQGVVSGKGSQMTEWVLNDEGKVVPSMTLPEYKNMLTLYRKWIDNGWFDAEFLSQNDDSQSQLWNSGHIGIWFCDPHRALDWNYEPLHANFPEAEAWFMPLPADENGVKYFVPSYGVGRVLFIHQNSTIAAEVIKFLDKMVSDPDFYNLCKQGIEGKHWIDNGENWDYPEGITVENRPYGEIYRPLSWEFIDILKPGTSTNAVTAQVHNALNEEYADAELIYSGLEGFTIDSSEMGQYSSISVGDYLFNEMFKIPVGVYEVEDFDSIVKTWYDLGGQQLVDEYTRQYSEWKSAN